jgi:VWFA-related protein
VTRRIAGALVLLAAVAPALGAQQRPRFRMTVDAVQVDVRVARGGRPVTGLTSANFELRDSDVTQKIEVFEMDDVPLHLVLVLDASDSVRGRLLDQLKEATLAAIASLRDDDRVTLLTFSDELRLAADAAGDRDAAARSVEKVESRGWTSLHDAIFHALLLGPSGDRRSLLIVFSDGVDTASWLRADVLLDDARRTDAVVYAVSRPQALELAVKGLPGRQMGELRERGAKWFMLEPQLYRERVLSHLAEQSGGAVHSVWQEQDLRGVFAEIVAEFRTRYLLNYIPDGVSAGGWHPIDVKLKGAKGDVTARRGYQR